MENYELNIDVFTSRTIDVKKSGRDPKWNKRPIVGIKNGKVYPFESCYHAARKLKAKNVHTMARNILKVCNKQRKTICGIMWFLNQMMNGGITRCYESKK